MPTDAESDEDMRELAIIGRAVETLIATLKAAKVRPSCVLYVAGKLIDGDATVRGWPIEESIRGATEAAHIARRVRLCTEAV